MRTAVFRFCLTVMIAAAMLGTLASVAAQKQSDKKKASPPESKQPESGQDNTIKIDTDLVTVPVIVSDRHDVYVPDMRREEFILSEDGVKQEIAFFASTKEPFHVVLMLDTSLSTSLQKLKKIQQAAHEFIEQLQGSDRVSILSFDSSVKELCYFTGDRTALRQAINSVQGGGGTVLYDAMKFALNSLKRVKANRKAIVILTDGVDWHSDSTTFDDNIEALEEASVIVYPIRYNTRPEVEAMLRDQKNTNLATIFGGTTGTTPPTMPGETGPPARRPGQDDPYKLPIPRVELPPIGGGRYPGRNPDDPRPPDNRYPDDRRPPNNRYPDDRRSPDDRRYPGDRRNPGSRYPDPTDPNSPVGGSRNTGDPMLDNVYRIGDQYLNELAAISGGELYRADMITDLPDVFMRIAGELRNQYLLGYYPTNVTRDDKYRKIQVKTARKDTIIRARPGYRASKNKS